MGQQPQPPQRGLAFDPGGDVVRQGDDLVRRPENELTRVQDERLVPLGLDLAGQVRLVRGGVDVWIPMVLEDRKKRSRRTSIEEGCSIEGS